MSNDIFEQYAVLDAQIKALEEKKATMRSQILSGIVENGKESIETPFGKFSYIALSKWTYPQEILDLEEELKAKQAAILSAAASLLKPGGRLVYATCSLLPEENQTIVSDFVATHPQFTLLNCSELLAQQKISLNTGEFLQLSPRLHQTDGFFAAALTRIEATKTE